MSHKSERMWGRPPSSPRRSKMLPGAFKGKKLAPFNPSNDVVISAALDMLQLQDGDLLYDLGCGDGRFLTEAARLHAVRGIGIEYDLAFVDKAKNRVEKDNLCDLVTIRHSNVLDEDFSQATALFIYLVPEGMRALKDKLIAMLQNGTRIVTYVFTIPDLEPMKVVEFKSTRIMYYTQQSLQEHHHQQQRK